MYFANVERASVPSRTRRHQPNIFPYSTSRALPMRALSPRRSLIFVKSRFKCAQQS